jgi:TRAP-type C4-dicarboxylate transport system substrate-binding protein
MMHRRTAQKIFGASLASAAVSGETRRASAAETIKIGTLAPSASPWGQVFKVWADAVSKKSNGSVELQFFHNGTQGDEAAMVGKMKAGQLDGAAITAVGLGKIYQPITALQMPGLFTSWGKLDAARDALKGEFEKGASDAGFTLLGWGDVGKLYLLSKGVVIKSPDDLKGKKPWMWRDDVTQPSVYQVIGGVSPVPLNVPEVLPNLNTGAIDDLVTSALVAEQMQWSGKLDTITTSVNGLAIGALTISSKRLASLTEEGRNLLMDTGKIAANALTKRIRSEDDAAFERLKKKMTNVNPGADDLAKWDNVFKQARQRLAQGVFSADLVSRLEGLAR